jgi:hypothetical protein
VAVRFDGEHVGIERSSPSALDETAGRAVGEALAEAFAALPGGRAPEVHRLVVDAIGAHPASFAVPVAPVSALLADAGLDVREAWAGPAGQAWSTPAEQARRRRVEELLADADSCCRRAAGRALDAWHDWLRASADAPPEPMDAGEANRLADDIDHGPAAAVLAEVASLGRPVIHIRHLGEWADAVAAGKDGAGVEYLRARGADAGGDPVAAEARLEEGLRLAPGHPACLGFLAELAQDRGDAPRAVDLMRRAGRPPGPEAMRELEPFVPSRPPGRNEPCPCGSGRKFKACCAGRAIRRPLVDRARWLLARATRHANRADALTLQSLRQLFEGAGGASSGDLVNDMLLFPSGGLARYLDTRGPLIAADELACARSWTGQPMRLLEPASSSSGEDEDRDRGQPTSVIDLRSGERLSLADTTVVDGIEPGSAVLTRALPVDGVWLHSAAVVPIGAVSRQRALDLLDDEVRPFQLLHLLVDLQVDGLRAGAPPPGVR